MKLNKKICFIIFSVYLICSSFSAYNLHAFSVIENGKTAISISEPDIVESGYDFLNSVKSVLGKANIDFLVRQTEVNSNMLTGKRYYSTDMNPSFVNVNLGEKISDGTGDFVISNFSSPEFKSRVVMKPSPVGNAISVTSIENLNSIETSQMTVLVNDSDLSDSLRLLKENRFSAEIYESIVLSTSDYTGLFLSGIVYCISVLFLELSSGKRDIILKTAGFDVFNILFWKMKSEMRFYGITFLATFFAMILLAKTVFHTGIADFFAHQIDNLSLACMFVGIALLISIIVPLFHNRHLYVGGSKPANTTYRVGVAFHAVALTVFTVIILQTLHGFLLPELRQAIELKQRAADIDHIASLKLNTGGEGDAFLEYAEKNPDKANELYATLNLEYNALMVDDSQLKRSRLNDKYLWELNSEGFDFPRVTVNNNYLVRNEIKDIDSNIIRQTSVNNKEILILIPDHYDYSDPSKAYLFWKERGDYDVCELRFITYDSKCRIPLYSNGLSESSPLPPVIEVYPVGYTFDMICLEDLLSNCYFEAKTDYPYEEIYPLLVQTGATDVVTDADFIGNLFVEKLADEMTGIEVVIGEMILYVIALAGLIIFNASNYVAENIKRIVCGIVEGKTVLDSVKSYYVFLSITYLLSATVSVVFCRIHLGSFPSVWAFLLSWGIITVADLIFSMIQLRSITIRNYNSVIKGEN